MKNKKSVLSIICMIILVILGVAFKDVSGDDSNSSISSVISQEEYSESVPVSENISEMQEIIQPYADESDNDVILESGSYTTPEDVAEYIHTFGTLPDNFITKEDAKAIGWKQSEGNLWEVAEGMSIGGDRFHNSEGLLPDEEGRIWTECDVNYQGGFRGAERVIFSNDGLIYYTDDHYQTFTRLY